MEFILLHSFNNYMDAHILLGRLKQEGIECWLKNENSSTVLPLWNDFPGGGIQLMVDSLQEEEARRIMQDLAGSNEPDAEES